METTQFLCNLSKKKWKRKKRCRFSMREIWQVKYRQALKQFLHKERGQKNRKQ
jgi:hypothetical protein